MGLPQALDGFLQFHRVPVGPMRAGWARIPPQLDLELPAGTELVVWGGVDRC